MGKSKKNNSILNLLQREVNFSQRWINKFTVVGFGFFVWIAFFDNHSLIESYKVNSMLNRMEYEKKEYLAKIEEAKAEKVDLNNNLEKFAREKYFMHKSNEEVFIIEKGK